jgi:putative transposase
MARIDAFYLEDPTAGSRRMVLYLARDGIPISRDRVRNLMRCMGLRAIYQKPRTTVPGEPSERFPCLVDVRAVTAPDQVWATDITYIPLRKGFLYQGLLEVILRRGMVPAPATPAGLAGP